VIVIGGGTWSNASYTTRSATNKAAGIDAFDYSNTAHATGVYALHATVDPKTVNKKGDHADMSIREALDSDEHPESLAIGVIFDVTGSMGHIPRVLQEKLPKLYGLILEKGYVEDPQILYGAVGDANSDRVPLQIGQFESDNKADEALGNLILEGGGGGGNHESYELAAYFMARKTYIDCFEKRGKKGYLFLIGDERIYSQVDRKHVENLIGDSLQENISTEDLFRELQEKWDVFFLFASEGSYTPDQVIDAGAGDSMSTGWRKLLNQNAIILEKAEDVCETIALTIGLCEGAIDLDEGLDHLREVGVDSDSAGRVSKALATVGGGGAAVAEIDGAFGDAEDGAERL
jgi:hypothetical protein